MSAGGVEVWEAPLRRFVAARVAGPDAEDLLQEILLRLHKGRSALREAAREPGWVFTVARRVIIDHHRRARLVVEVGAEAAEAIPEPSAAEAAREQLRRCLGPMMATLPAEQRQALTLTELGGLTQAAAAAQLGLPVPTLKARVQRGRQRLRSDIERCCALSFDGRGAVVEVIAREAPCAC